MYGDGRSERVNYHNLKATVNEVEEGMSVSIAEMERVAIGSDNVRMEVDLGDVIELGDLTDDLGLNMLMNPSKMSVNRDTSRSVSVPSFPSFPPAPQQQQQEIFVQQGQNQYPPRPQRTTSFSVEPPRSDTWNNGMGGIEITPPEPLEPISLGVMDSQPIDMSTFGAPPIEVNVTHVEPKKESTFFGNMFGNTQTATGPNIQLQTARDPIQEKKDKSDLLNKLQRLEAKGFPVIRKFTMDNSLEEMKTEYARLVDARNLETPLKFQRQMLMGAITGMEWLNDRFDPFDLKLDGWSESVHENVEDFDEIFEELYDKYKDRGKMSPEIRLMMAIGGSGFMCHVSNSFFRSKMPSMDDVLRNNPELARQMAAAAANQAGPGFGNFMGAALNAGAGAGAGSGAGSGASPFGGSPFPGGVPPLGPLQSNASPSAGTTGAFFESPGAAAAANPAAVAATLQQQKVFARREMSGPTGVDDILKTFETMRAAEAASSMEPPTGFVMGPVVTAVREGSVVSASDLQSQAESARTAATGGKRKKRAQPPSGSTISLNV